MLRRSLVVLAAYLKQPFARNRLNKTNTAYQRSRCTQSPHALEVTFDDRKLLRRPANGTPVRWTREDGEPFLASVTRREGNLVQTYNAEDGMRLNTFRLNEDGRTRL